MAIEPLQTAEAHSFPTVRQLSIFIENRVGQLARLTRVLDKTEVRILAISIINGVDCAVIRMVVDDPDEAASTLQKHKIPVADAELLAISLPPGKRALLEIWGALMSAEVSIQYTYPLLVRPRGEPAIVLQADNHESAIRVLKEKGIALLDQADLVA